MPAKPVPIDVKTKGQTWLLPPYNWSHRRIAKEHPHGRGENL
ncbi:hypothetical protein [Providencia sp. Me31A]